MYPYRDLSPRCQLYMYGPRRTWDFLPSKTYDIVTVLGSCPTLRQLLLALRDPWEVLTIRSGFCRLQ